ncbi:GNAT family N-acetyltransferase [Streptomyces sp. NPDC048409]|uniref:GNAT family N-acetyltransferase n=1 Tax=Streptomyces sp. NPDC048409 TaxID=3154723 RepID=UPI00341492F9
MEIRTYTRADEFDTIPERLWDRCSSGLGMTFQYGIVREMFAMGTLNVLAAFEGEQLLGYTCAYVEKDGSGSVHSHPALTLTDPVYLRIDETDSGPGPEELEDMRRTLQEVLSPVLVVRNGLDSRVVLTPDLDAADAREITSFLVDGLIGHARREGISTVVFARIRAKDELLLEVLESRGWSSCLIGGGGSIDLAGCAGDFEGYLKRLPSKRRTSVRHEMKAFRAQGLEIMQEDLPEFLEAFVGLEVQNYLKYGQAMTTAELFQRRNAWHRAVGGRLKAASCRKEGRLVGGLLFYDGGGRIDVLSVGFDYAEIEGAFAYFNMVFYWIIQYALAHSVTTVDFGTEALKGKLARGADLYPLHLALDPGASGNEVIRDWLSLVGRRNHDAPWAKPLRSG